MNQKPNFAAWHLETLAEFASDAFDTMVRQQETIEQLRQDFKDAMEQNRKLLTKDPK